MGRNRARGLRDIRTHSSLRPRPSSAAVALSSRPDAGAGPLLGRGSTFGFRIGLGATAPRAVPPEKPRAWIFVNKQRRRRDQDMLLVDRVAVPEVDVFEEGRTLIVLAELPGVRDEDIDVHVQGDVVMISTRPVEGGERRFYRELLLPFAVAADPVARAFRNGILELSLARERAKGGAAKRSGVSVTSESGRKKP